MTDKYLRVATDGSGTTGKEIRSSWAWVSEDGRYKTGNLQYATNNYAELTAIKEAIKIKENLLIVADSQYSINVITNPNAKIKKNAEIISYIKKEIIKREKQGLKTEFIHQYSHTTRKNKANTKIEVILNHLADTLCTKMRNLENPSKPVVKEGIQSKLQEKYNRKN